MPRITPPVRAGIRLETRTDLLALEEVFDAVTRLVPASSTVQTFRSRQLHADVSIKRHQPVESDGNTIQASIVAITDDGLEVSVRRMKPQWWHRWSTAPRQLEASYRDRKSATAAFRPIWPNASARALLQDVWTEALDRAALWDHWWPRLVEAVSAEDVEALSQALRNNTQAGCNFGRINSPSGQANALLQLCAPRHDTLDHEPQDMRCYRLVLDVNQAPSPLIGLEYQSSQHHRPLQGPNDPYRDGPIPLGRFDGEQIEEVLTLYEGCKRLLLSTEPAAE